MTPRYKEGEEGDRSSLRRATHPCSTVRLRPSVVQSVLVGCMNTMVSMNNLFLLYLDLIDPRCRSCPATFQLRT